MQKTKKTLFEYTASLINGEKVSLSKFKGKNAYLLVNVASECEKTPKNYEQMDQIYDKYGDKGLEIFAFPCNQFSSQEPYPNHEIQHVVRKKTGAKIKYPMFEKLKVNGDDCHDIYTFLKQNSRLWNEQEGKCEDIRWNFGKFLVDGQGYVKNYYDPDVTPLELEDDIKKLLQKEEKQ